LTALTEQSSTKNAEINELQSQVAQLQVQLDNLADSTAVFKAKQDLANTETNFVQSSKEYLANLFAARWISRSLDLASKERFPKMQIGRASCREIGETAVVGGAGKDTEDAG